jgi:hypothetical protein
MVMKTPEDYFQEAQEAMAEAAKFDIKTHDAATLAILAMASALLGICAQFIREQGDD